MENRQQGSMVMQWYRINPSEDSLAQMKVKNDYKILYWRMVDNTFVKNHPICNPIKLINQNRT